MKRLSKLLLFLVSLAGLLFSAGLLSAFYPMPYVNDAMDWVRGNFIWADNALAGFCAFLCLCFFVLLLVAVFYPNRYDFLTIEKGKGKLLFSKKTIESSVRYSFSNLDGITQSKVKVKIRKKPEDTRVYVELSINGAARPAAITETAQEKIALELLSSLGIEVRSVTVKINEYNPGTGALAKAGEVAPEITEAVKEDIFVAAKEDVKEDVPEEGRII